MILIIQLIFGQTDRCEKVIHGLTRLLDGSGVCSERDLGSSFTRSRGVSISFAFPLSFCLDLPPGAGGTDSCKLREEFDREIETSSSTTTVPESDSNNIG